MPELRREDALIGRVWKALEDVLDMEIPINVVDLGMIRDVRVEGARIAVDLTFTSMGSPGIEWTRDDVRKRIEALDEAEHVEVNVVWSPPWTVANLTPRGREALRALGVVP